MIICLTQIYKCHFIYREEKGNVIDKDYKPSVWWLSKEKVKSLWLLKSKSTLLNDEAWNIHKNENLI